MGIEQWKGQRWVPTDRPTPASSQYIVMNTAAKPPPQIVERCLDKGRGGGGLQCVNRPRVRCPMPLALWGASPPPPPPLPCAGQREAEEHLRPLASGRRGTWRLEGPSATLRRAFCHRRRTAQACRCGARGPAAARTLRRMLRAGVHWPGAEMYWKRGGIRLFKSWTLVRLRGSGG